MKYLIIALGLVFSLNANAQFFDTNIKTESFLLDTITDTGLDTLTLSNIYASKWTYNWVTNVVRESGTGNPILILQESPVSSGDVWKEVSRDTITATGVYQLNGEIIYGRRQRLILDGEGTAVHSFNTYFVAKKD